MESLKYPSLPGAEESGAEELYFSYGSNMHLQQMAARCRDSRIFAKGILRNYKWQINSRGGANVVEGSREDFVEGIVFTVSPSDVEALRHYEGVKQQFYAEGELDIELDRIMDTALDGRKPADAAKILALYKSDSRLTESNSSANAVIPEQGHTKSDNTVGDTHLHISQQCSTTSHQSAPEPDPKSSHEKPSINKAEEPGFVQQNDQKSERISLTGSPTSPQTSLQPKFDSKHVENEEQLCHHDIPNKSKVTNPEVGGKVYRKALIYISYEYRSPGIIREEYIGRMKLAMADARMLGVSQDYLETSLHPLIFGKRTGPRPDEGRSQAQMVP